MSPGGTGYPERNKWGRRASCGAIARARPSPPARAAGGAQPSVRSQTAAVAGPASSSAMYVFLLLPAVATASLLSLDGDLWAVRNANGSVAVPANVPGGIYSDLRAAGVIGDPLYRFNDVEYRWVARDNWTYSGQFETLPELRQKRSVMLVFHGIDTVADVVLNGLLLGRVDNMFVRFVFFVKELLRDDNELQVRFTSPVLEAERRSRDNPVPPSCVPAQYNGECHVNQLRKMQASFGWDWGVALPSVGLWKSVHLLSFDGAVVQDVVVHWNGCLKLDVVLVAAPSTQVYGWLEASLEGGEHTRVPLSQVADDEGELLQELELEVPNDVKLWWPNGEGPQSLYNISVRFVSATSNEVSEKTVRYGFRNISLVQKRVDPAGLTFYLEVNGRSVFLKGSNWIPANTLPELSTDAGTVRRLLEAARDANMNALRVWGGGVYESDAFYEAADELGILVWQDMMFACNMYPATPQFLASAAAEVRYQVRRLQHHASVALWAGNNENEAALRQNWYGTAGNFSAYQRDYVSLYVGVVKTVVTAEDVSRPFVVSSPSNGVESEREGYIARDPQSSLYGDTHYYNYLADGWDANIYSQTRLSSEYGFQSLPSLHTFLPAMDPIVDLIDVRQFAMHRQHQPGGYIYMNMQIRRHLLYPEMDYTLSGFQEAIYLSQINQAMSTKVETEHYRRHRNVVNSIGEGMTMGALYWQLNDVWQAPSWSSIEFGGRWKMLHYYARKFFSPVMVSGLVTPAGRLEVYVVSDLRHELPNVTVAVRVHRWEQFEPSHVRKVATSFPPGASTLVLSEDLTSFLLLGQGCCNQVDDVRRYCFLTLSADAAPDNFLLLAPLKDSALPPADVTVAGVSQPQLDDRGRQYRVVTLAADAVAPFVWLESRADAGHFSDNGFLMTQPTWRVLFYPESRGDPDIAVTTLATNHNSTSPAA
ncbi:hypothetical protein PR048_028700 [Dryococelus australis]|uniref:beta-mannosidase n=1 Tax=Dryococelus australis TaxID=614101 RepID=A0ABQ9GBB4_9NEOP|nr:hypothetical protein PR048_028700 [Dryococelus australis]